MLIAIKEYLHEHPRATVADLGLTFRTSPEVIKDMLSVLERRGYVTPLAAVSSPCTGCQSSCGGCPVVK